jgi:hypothetical protein
MNKRWFDLIGEGVGVRLRSGGGGGGGGGYRGWKGVDMCMRVFC